MNRKFMFGGILVAVIIGYIGYMIFGSTYVYYYSVPEVVAQKSAIQSGTRDVRVDGRIQPGSIKWEPQQTLLSFTITDQHGKAAFPVVYKGIKPDNMEDPELQVIVEGRFDQSDNFQARTLLTRCPSKYEDKPVSSNAKQ